MSSGDQLSLDYTEGKRLQEAGKDRREAAEEDFLAWARDLAAQIAVTQGWVCIDDLRVAAAREGREPRHPNTWGAVFRGDGWQAVGHVHSAVVSNRGREVKRWRVVDGR